MTLMYSSCLKEFSIDCLVHVALTLSWPHSLIFEVQHVKFHVISLVCQRDEILFFVRFQSQPCLASFVLGKIKQKLQMIRQKCFPLYKNLAHLGGGGLFAITGTSPLQSHRFPVSSLPALQGPGWALLNFLSSFASKSSLTTKMRHMTYCDDLEKRGNFILLSKALLPFSLAGVSSVTIPLDALVSKGKLCFSAGLECPSRGW